MAFPVPSEAFAAVEICELQRRGIDLSVKTIRNIRSDYQQVAGQQGVRRIPVEHANWRTPLRGFVQAAIRPSLALRLWWRLLTTLAHRPVVFLACIFWSLRCFELLAIVGREKPDVVHLYWGHVPAMLGWLVLEAYPAQKVTIGLSAYDLEMALPLSFVVAQRCAGVRSWADSNLPAIQSQKIAAGRVQMIYQGIATEVFRNLTHVATKVQRIVFAGRLIPEKGPGFAIELVRQLKARFPDIELVILGDGPLSGTLREISKQFGLESNVQFHGHVTQAEMATELAAAMLFVLPTVHSAERLPNVIKEAAAAGCCCLTTPTPGIEVLIRDGETGRILPANDLKAWVDAVTQLLEHPEQARKMAEASAQCVREHFDIRHTTDRLVSWWESIAFSTSIPEVSR